MHEPMLPSGDWRQDEVARVGELDMWYFHGKVTKVNSYDDEIIILCCLQKCRRIGCT